MNYTKLDADDYVVGGGICQDEAFSFITPPLGGRLLPNILPPPDRSRRWRWTQTGFADTGSLVEVDYAGNRRASYPPAGDQFDALWHAMDDGLLPKIEPFYSDILAVKERFPKPSN